MAEWCSWRTDPTGVTRDRLTATKSTHGSRKVGAGVTTDDNAGDSFDIRVISVYATNWLLDTDPPVQERLSLGHLEEFYEIYQDQLPKVFVKQQHTPASFAFEATQEDDTTEPISPADQQVRITSVLSRLFVLPSDQVVAAFDFHLRCANLGPNGRIGAVDTKPIIKLLNRCAYANLVIGGRRLPQHIDHLMAGRHAHKYNHHHDDSAPIDDVNNPFPPERHQIVFAEQIAAPPTNSRKAPSPEQTDEVIKAILYRVQAPDRPEFSRYERIKELSDGNKICAVTPYASLLSNHQDYLENSIFLTVVQAVGTAARFRQIWHQANHEVRNFRRTGQAQLVGRQSRRKLQNLADEFGNLQLDLGFSVETSADLGLLIPSLRVTSFHHRLHEAMELRERSETVSRMFNRLDASIQSELTAIDIRSKREDEQRRLRWEVSLGILTFIAIPISVLGAFFGSNDQQVNQQWSIFDLQHYGRVYAGTLVLTLIPFVTWLVLFIRDQLRERAIQRNQRQEIRRTPLGTTGGRQPDPPATNRGRRAARRPVRQL